MSKMKPNFNNPERVVYYWDAVFVHPRHGTRKVKVYDDLTLLESAKKQWKLKGYEFMSISGRKETVGFDL